MNKKLIAAALTAAALAGCQSMPCHDDATAGRPPNPSAPKVSIVDGQYIVVDQEPLVFPKDKVNVRIVWQLPKDGGYRFPENGIVFEKSPRTEMARGGDVSLEITECRPIEEGLKFTCFNKHSKPGTYKYTINVEKDGKRLTPLDPSINNF